MSARACRRCGCTEADCSQCIKRTGSRCWWVKMLEDDRGPVCSACVSTPASSDQVDLFPEMRRPRPRRAAQELGR